MKTKMLLLLFLFGLALAMSHSGEHQLELQRGNCPLFWYTFNGRCYKFFATHLTWADAELSCVSQGANLVSIQNVEEDDFVSLLIRNFDPAQGYTWIGLSDLHREGGWMWSDGSPVDFLRWTNGQPDNGRAEEHCVHKNYGAQLGWNDNICSLTFAFVCVYRTTCHI